LNFEEKMIMVDIKKYFFLSTLKNFSAFEKGLLSRFSGDG
jgi:hypothetical protein